MGTTKYLMQSHETDVYPEQRKAMQVCLDAAGKDYKKAGDRALPFPVYLAGHLSKAGDDGKIFKALSETGDEYIRSYHDKTPPLPPGIKFDEKL